MLFEVNDEYFITYCTECGCKNSHSFGRGGAKLDEGPYNLPVDSTLIISVDDGPDITITFSNGDFPDFTNVTCEQLIAKLNAAIPGATSVIDDDNDILIESNTVGLSSCISVKGGTALSTFKIYPGDYRPVVVGIPAPPNTPYGHNYNMIKLRPCCCGTVGFYHITFDAMSASEYGSLGHLHRQAVNTLGEHLKENGWVHPALSDYYETETAKPIDMHDDISQISIDPSLFPNPHNLVNS